LALRRIRLLQLILIHPQLHNQTIT